MRKLRETQIIVLITMPLFCVYFIFNKSFSAALLLLFTIYNFCSKKRLKQVLRVYIDDIKVLNSLSDKYEFVNARKDQIYKGWQLDLKSINYDNALLYKFLPLYKDFFYNGINNLQPTIDACELILLINRYVPIFNQEIVDYYFKDFLDIFYKKQKDLSDIQQFLTDDELIIAVQQGCKINLNQVNEQVKQSIIFIQSLKGVDLNDGK